MEFVLHVMGLLFVMDGWVIMAGTFTVYGGDYVGKRIYQSVIDGV